MRESLSEMSVKVGFLGAGNIATFHSQMLSHSGENYAPAAVFDIDRERAQRFSAASGAPVVDSEAAVVEASDAVYVCTWTSEHERLVALACDAGRAVFCEKPLGPDLASAHRVAASVTQAGVVNQVGLILRRSPVFCLLRALVAEDASGRPMSVVFRDDQYLPIHGAYGSTWRADSSKAGSGVLLEHSIHDVDLLEWILGPINSVEAAQASFHELDGIEDSVAAMLTFANGAVGVLATIWHDVGTRVSNRCVEVFCERLWARLEGEWFGSVAWDRGNGEERHLEGSELVAEAVARSPHAGANPDGAFVAAVRDGGGAWPSVTEAVRAHEIVDAAYRSAATFPR